MSRREHQIPIEQGKGEKKKKAISEKRKKKRKERKKNIKRKKTERNEEKIDQKTRKGELKHERMHAPEASHTLGASRAITGGNTLSSEQSETPHKQYYNSQSLRDTKDDDDALETPQPKLSLTTRPGSGSAYLPCSIQPMSSTWLPR